jgi:hypothetical protein
VVPKVFKKRCFLNTQLFTTPICCWIKMFFQKLTPIMVLRLSKGWDAT